MAKVFPLHPPHPERICWGCDHYCPAGDMRCGNGQSRTQHPVELLGDDWYEHGDWGLDVSTGDKGVVPGHAVAGAGK
jgi:hypothetical protein